jgi:UDP-2,4-diacetamido-2,4,6-trideoxy-beta-L-altropyranose hydrolase
MSGRLVLRADGSENMGMGHIMRCLAIADAAMARGWDCVLASTALPEDMRQKIERRLPIHFPAAEQADETAWLKTILGDSRQQALIVDGYHFDSRQRKAWRNLGQPVVTIDDNRDLDVYHTDILVNPNFHATQLNYDKDKSIGHCLLGAEYFPLRANLRSALQVQAIPLAARDKILISFGGSDPLQLTGPVTRNLRNRLPGAIGLDVVIGPGYPRHGDLAAELAAEIEHCQVHVDPTNLAELMASAGLAVTAGGGTVMELAAFATPALLVVVAGNQSEAGKASRLPIIEGRDKNAVEKIAAKSVALWSDLPARRDLSMMMAGCVDGRGADRIIDELERIVG